MTLPVHDLIWAFISSRDGIEPAERAARAGRISGIWLLASEMQSPGATAELVNRMQLASPHPLLVGVDAEAGLGSTLNGATELPTAMAIGATGDPELAHLAAEVTAREASACGINVNAAPSLDVNTNPANPIINTRSFGGDPALVSSLGTAFIQGTMQAAAAPHAVMPIAKHFPGHGDTVEDSHLQLGTVARSRDQLDAVELAPFRASIAAGVPIIMSAHVAYPALDPSNTPGTLSQSIMTALLRRELGFEGVTVSDAMDMYAIAHNYERGDAAVRAVLAGVDLVLTDHWDEVFEALTRAVQQGELPASRVREAAERVQALKRRIFGPDLALAKLDPRQAELSVGLPGHHAVADRIASASITLVRGAVPRGMDRPLVLATRLHKRTGPSVEEDVKHVLAAVGWRDADLFMLDDAPDADAQREALQRAGQATEVAILHFNRVQSFHPGAVLVSAELCSLVDRLAEAGLQPTVVSMGSPYILPLFRRAGALLCSYSTCGASVRATLRVLRGQLEPKGRLPVSLA